MHFAAFKRHSCHFFLQHDVVKRRAVMNKRDPQIKAVVVQHTVFADPFKRDILAAVFIRTAGFHNLRTNQFKIRDAAVERHFLSGIPFADRREFRYVFFLAFFSR